MMRFAYTVVTFVAVAVVASPFFFSPPLKLVWNVSASAPVGLYLLKEPVGLDITDLVAVRLPERWQSFAVERGYIGNGTLLLKRIVGLPGQMVCRLDGFITVDEVTIGHTREADQQGRLLPKWDGCQMIDQHKIFLMNWQVDDSLDGRYFGPLPANTIIGLARPFWTDEAGDGRFEWRAPTQ
ncbi:S26 family signal peptidase [uncultured Cohaesibacter sp.]|uniref:S26 family signal peptidase n=1 Tax=uncultured Cohaesibacter sp. TaxID=1002546 RepID=UPI0029C8A23F|nr:S26 family signal peptidase [uncultured Cohaesibacter sp.]